ncbi:MAG: polysaccharide deacetylase family protein [Pyrinomonadaceae bacterium]
MKLHVRERLRRSPQWLRNKLAPGGLILMYHRVADLPSDPFSLAVSPQHFAEHLEALRKHSRPTSLRQLTESLQHGKSPRRAVVVTFDDGYTDNLSNAKPLLERYDVPATAFVTTGHIGEGREFMWDELERLLLRPGRLPETLSMKVQGNAREWRLGEAAVYSEDDYQRHRRWKAEERDDPSERHTLFRSLHKLLKPLPESEQQSSLDQLLAWADATAAGRETHRTMTADEVRRLDEDGLVEIGSHTVTHPALSALTVSQQRREILESKAHLAEILGHPVRSFAYPFGGTTDYTMETVGILRESGYTSACSNFPGVVRGDTDLFQLPRIDVRDCDGDSLISYLRWLALG